MCCGLRGDPAPLEATIDRVRRTRWPECNTLIELLREAADMPVKFREEPAMIAIISKHNEWKVGLGILQFIHCLRCEFRLL